ALELLPAAAGVDGPVRVRSIQVHGRAREEALAGERTSLQLSGAPLEALRRGLQLGAPGAFAATTSLLARITLLPDAPAPLRGFTPVRLHLHAGEALGRMRPLGTGTGRGGAGRAAAASEPGAAEAWRAGGPGAAGEPAAAGRESSIPPGGSGLVEIRL